MLGHIVNLCAFVNQNNGVPRLGQLFGDCLSNAAGSPCYQRGPASCFLWIHPCPRVVKSLIEFIFDQSPYGTQAFTLLSSGC
jgi:hypothetical protein